MTDKLESALKLSEEILAGIEMETLSISSVALRCLHLARLLSDADAIEWFQYETTGYPKTTTSYIDNNAFETACAHGREINSAENGTRRIFSELADELEVKIRVDERAIGNLTTEGVSVAGDWASVAMRELRIDVRTQTTVLSNSIRISQRHLSILRGQYYAYALSANLELKFSQQAEEVFRSYRLSVDGNLTKFAPESLKRLDAAYERLSSSNPESWSQALTSCRRVFQEISDALFKGSRDEPYTTKSGKILDVSGDHYVNRLYATIDSLTTSSDVRRLVGSNIMYVVDLVDSLHSSLCRGVHDLNNPLTYNEARACILHTYILLGDISTLTFANK